MRKPILIVRLAIRVLKKTILWLKFSFSLDSLQVQVDWEKINAKIEMEIEKESERPNAKPYNNVGRWTGYELLILFQQHSLLISKKNFENNFHK